MVVASVGYCGGMVMPCTKIKFSTKLSLHEAGEKGQKSQNSPYYVSSGCYEIRKIGEDLKRFHNQHKCQRLFFSFFLLHFSEL